MAREIKELIWCDLCRDLDDIQTPATEMPPISVGQKKPRVLAVCTQHKTSFFDQFIEALETSGEYLDQLSVLPRTRSSVTRPVPRHIATSSTGKPIVCPLATECGGKPLKNVSTVSSHLRQIHAMNLFEAVGKDGQLFDVDGAPVAMPEIREHKKVPDVKRAECDQEDCDTVYEYPGHSKPVQALGVHKAKVHGIKGIGKKRREELGVA